VTRVPESLRNGDHGAGTRTDDIDDTARDAEGRDPSVEDPYDIIAVAAGDARVCDGARRARRAPAARSRGPDSRQVWFESDPASTSETVTSTFALVDGAETRIEVATRSTTGCSR
jgi:hypothetical protein